MSWTLVFTARYERRAARFLRRHPDLLQSYRKTLLLLGLIHTTPPCGFMPYGDGCRDCIQFRST